MRETSKNLELLKIAKRLNRSKYDESFLNYFVGAVSRYVDEKDWVSAIETAEACMGREGKKDGKRD